mgnify:CR=1 FL=1
MFNSSYLNLKQNLIERNSGIQLLEVNDSYQLATLEKYYSYICTMLDNRPKPNLSQAAFEVLSIVAYNQNVTRAEIEAIRGVSADGTVYKLLEFDLIEESGKLDAPGRPTMYRVTNKFMKMFGISNLEELPDLPRYKLDENEQIVIDDVIEAPMPAREDEDIENKKANESEEE